MEEKEIIEGNKLIAEFMGAVESDTHSSIMEINGDVFHLEDLEYNSSWDWLMPVVEKIESMGHKTIIGGGDYWGNYCNIIYGVDRMKTDDTKALGQGKTKIEAVYKAVVQYINWYNTNKTK